MRVRTASDRALLVEVDDADAAVRLTLAAASVSGITETVPGARTVLVRFDSLRTSVGPLRAALTELDLAAVAVTDAAEVRIPVVYDGEDLAEVAAALGVSEGEVVARHLAADWRVAFSGFAPGFAYLTGDDPLFDVPRRTSPRTRVPAGSVGLAGRYSGVYPRESPGGWQLIGRTDAVLWDLDRDPPALLTPGARMRFTQVDAVGDVPRVSTANPTTPDEHSAAIEIVSTALPLLVQDSGRPGLAALGVPASGAADRTALRDANHAVGNQPGAAVLEGIGPAELRFHGAGVAVITGAESESVIRSGAPRELRHGTPFAFRDGDVVAIGPPQRGLRFVLGVRGGIRSTRVLGSVATDTLSGLGPAPLVPGAVVQIGPAGRDAVHPEPWPRALPAPGETVEIEITLGPRDDWFTPAAVDALLEQEWEVTPRSDRVGIRLLGATPLERAVPGELPSEGVVTGALQVPPDGQPVLFLPDHPVTGGYPVIGAVTDRFLDLAGQLPPGVRVRFRVFGNHTAVAPPSK